MEPGHNTAAIIPVRGRRELLGEAMESVLGQSLCPAELLVIMDDYDESEALELKARYRSIENCQLHFVRGEGTGPGSARNLGATLARSSWLAFLDSDDIWQKERLERLFAYLKKRPQLSVCHNEESWLRSKKGLTVPESLRPSTGRFLRASLSNCMISPSSLLIRRTVFLASGGFDPAYPVCEDFEFFLRLLKTRVAGLVPEKLTIKRSGNWPQLSASHNLDCYRLRALLTYLKDPEAPWQAEARRAALGRWKIVQQIERRYGGIDLTEFSREMEKIVLELNQKRFPATLQ